MSLPKFYRAITKRLFVFDENSSSHKGILYTKILLNATILELRKKISVFIWDRYNYFETHILRLYILPNAVNERYLTITNNWN